MYKLLGQKKSKAAKNQTFFNSKRIIQKKLSVGAANDSLEAEADAMADRVVQRSFDTSSLTRNIGPLLQRKCAACQEEEIQRKPLSDEITHIQKKEMGSADAHVTSDAVANKISSSRGGGDSMDRKTQDFMESSFGADFSSIRIHTGDNAVQLNRDLNAHAFTVGNDIFFNEGKYNPSTTSGKHLLAHELTHTVQQGAAHRKMIQRAEVDDSSTFICTRLADSKTQLNTEVNNRLSNARTRLTAASRAAHPSLVGPPSVSGPAMVRAAYDTLGAPFNMYLAKIEEWSNNNLTGTGGGHGLSVRSGTRYDNIPFRYYPIFGYMAPVVKLNGICAGTDKIGHMFQQGYQYHYISQSGVVSGSSLGLGLGDQYARAWGEYMEGVLSPATRANPAIMTWLSTMASSSSGTFGIRNQSLGHFGLTSTGVHSNGDLAANNAGMHFYRDLYSNPYMTFDISNYVVADWNERTSGNIFEHDLGTEMRSGGGLNPSDRVL